MSIKELIAQLRDVQDIYGNVDVEIYDVAGRRRRELKDQGIVPVEGESQVAVLYLG